MDYEGWADERLSGDSDLRPNAGSKIFVYMSQYKQKNPILFFQKAVYRFATSWNTTEESAGYYQDPGFKCCHLDLLFNDGLLNFPVVSIRTLCQ